MINFGDLDRTFIATHFHGNDDKIFRGERYKQVTHEIDFSHDTNTHWVSLGFGRDRERLFLDQNSAFVSTITEKIVRTLRDKIVIPEPFTLQEHNFLSVKQVLEIVNNTIDALTAPIGTDRAFIEKHLDLKLDTFLKEKERNSEGFIDVTLDELAEKNILVCRHKGLLAASILGSLVKNGMLPYGHVHQYRSTLTDDAGNPIGAHTWAVYRLARQNDIWICDPRWLTAEKADSLSVKRDYGEHVIKKMIRKLNLADEHQPEELTRAMLPLEPAAIFRPSQLPSSNDEATTDLITFARQGHLDLVIQMCKDKVKYNVRRTEKDSFGKTALHYLAEKKDSTNAILALLDAASWTTDPTTIQDKNGDTPLHIFAKTANDEALASIDKHFTTPGWLYGTVPGLQKMFYKAAFYQNQNGLTPIMVAFVEQPHNERLISNLVIAMAATLDDIKTYDQLRTALLTKNNSLYEEIKLKHPSLIGWNWDAIILQPHRKLGM